MSESSPHSPESSPHSPQLRENPQISDPPNPNPNSAKIDPSQKSQPSTPETQNPLPNSFSKETQKNPDQDSHSDEQKSHLLVDVDEEQEQNQQQQGGDDSDTALEQVDQRQEEIEDEEGINMTISPLPRSLITRNSKLGVSSVRRNKKGKKGFPKKNVNAGIQRKLQALSECFKPIPFVPVKIFDFSKHEENLKKLGLWEFVRLEFDSNVRVDLLVQLVAGFKKNDRVSYVNDCRVKVNRADLARALKLPVKKPTGDSGEGESFSNDFISFLEEFVSSWMLLAESDVWITPNEIVTVQKTIKDGQPHKVDWAGMIWFMVEKELAQGTGLNECYYASHLQQLIKDQRGDLLMESEKLGSENPKVVEVNLEDDEEDCDTEMLDVHDSSLGEERVKEHCVELKVDQKCVPEVEIAGVSDVAEKENDSDMVKKDGDADMVERADDVNSAEIDGEVSELKKADGVDVDEEKNENNVGSVGCLDEVKEMENIDNIEFAENVENSKGINGDDMLGFGLDRGWLMDGMNDSGQHIMQRCANMAGQQMLIDDVRTDGAEDVDDEVDEDDEQGFNFMGKSSMDMTSRNLIQAVETGHLSFTSEELVGQSSLGLMPSRAENDVMLNNPSMFNHVGKRVIDHDDDFSQRSLDDNHKRMRMDGDWDHKAPDVRMCLDQVMQWLEKAKMDNESEKYEQSNMMQMYANRVAEKEGEAIQWRFKFEELKNKTDLDAIRRDRELHLMKNVIDGYRRALKDTQRAFADYRKHCQIPDEPIYKDVGNGGVVKSIMELEREQLKEEEDHERMKYLLENTFNIHINEYESKWEELHAKVMSFDDRLTDAAKEVEQLKDDFVQRKKSDNAAMSEEVQSEAQEPVIKDAFLEDQMLENVVRPESVVVPKDTESEPQALPEDDLAEQKTSEDVPMPEEAENEAQGP